MKDRAKYLSSKDENRMIAVKVHLQNALQLMEEMRPASAFAARCQELIDGLDERDGD